MLLLSPLPQGSAFSALSHCSGTPPKQLTRTSCYHSFTACSESRLTSSAVNRDYPEKIPSTLSRSWHLSRRLPNPAPPRCKNICNLHSETCTSAPPTKSSGRVRQNGQGRSDFEGDRPYSMVRRDGGGPEEVRGSTNLCRSQATKPEHVMRSSSLTKST